MPSKADYDSIMRILTLRYDPLNKPLMPPLVASNFKPRIIDNLEANIVEIARKDLLNRYKRWKPKRVSLSLSGGIDSRLTLALMKNILPDVETNCVSVGFGDKSDEVEQAKELARIFDCDFHGVIVENVLEDLPKLISIVKEPRWNLYQYYSFEQGKKYSNVFYSGDGGDELFGGYTFRYRKFLSLLPPNAGWKEKAALYMSCHERDWVPDQDRIFGPKVKFSWDKIYQIFKPYFSNNLAPLDQVFLADFNGKLLYDWVPVNKALGNFFKLRLESIFLTKRMINFAAHIPWQRKYDFQKNTGKLLIRSILSNYKGNEKVSIVKRGFSIELTSLWNKNAREIAKKYVNAQSEVVKDGIISEKWIQSAYKNLQEDALELDPRYINKMLSILSLELWYRLFVSRSLKSWQKL